MKSNLAGSPRTTVVGILAGLLGAASAVGHLAGLPPTVTTAAGLVAALATVALGFFGVDPSTLVAARARIVQLELAAQTAADERRGAAS